MVSHLALYAGAVYPVMDAANHICRNYSFYKSKILSSTGV